MKREGMRKKKILWVVGACAVAVLAFVLVRRSTGEVVTFRVVDQRRGQPVTNVSVLVWKRWTPFPLEKLGLPFLQPWRVSSNFSADGAFKLRVPQNPDRFLAVFNAKATFPCYFVRNKRDAGDQVGPIPDVAQLRARTNSVLIPLERMMDFPSEFK